MQLWISCHWQELVIVFYSQLKRFSTIVVECVRAIWWPQPIKWIESLKWHKDFECATPRHSSVVCYQLTVTKYVSRLQGLKDNVLQQFEENAQLALQSQNQDSSDRVRSGSYSEAALRRYGGRRFAESWSLSVLSEVGFMVKTCCVWKSLKP